MELSALPSSSTNWLEYERFQVYENSFLFHQSGQAVYVCIILGNLDKINVILNASEAAICSNMAAV